MSKRYHFLTKLGFIVAAIYGVYVLAMVAAMLYVAFWSY